VLLRSPEILVNFFTGEDICADPNDDVGKTIVGKFDKFQSVAFSTTSNGKTHQVVGRRGHELYSVGNKVCPSEGWQHLMRDPLLTRIAHADTQC
jgi:hypothetical protein